MSVARREVLHLGMGAASAVGAAGLFGYSFETTINSPRFASGAAPSRPSRLRGVLWPHIELPPRRAYLHNLHTGETLDAVYFEKGRYVPDALAQAMRVLRDWRNGEEHVMDPRLFDVLHALRVKLDASEPFQVISGYRSPATNAELHAQSHEVASKSQHMLGKASDIRLKGVELENLHKAALSLGAGGVGFYPVSNFVHVDVGAVRHWAGA